MSFRNISISLRAALCFAVVTLLLVIFGAFSYIQLDHLRSAGIELEENALPSTQVIDDIQISLLHARLESIRFLANNDTAIKKSSEAKINEAVISLRKNSELYRSKLISSPQDKSQFESAMAAMDAYIKGLNTILI